ncbi:unnamed protein product [Ilex paraguariensis]|uniref:DUF674 domain-containing protein n=1 Tax=Ilex paraguariensis TaxID=185542 RepID=A0ABC8U8T8_9AQUA
MASSKVSLRLLVDTKGHKVLFAEASKEFVDFLIYLLSLPIGTVIKLLTKNSMVGCLGTFYGSIENLSETYLQPNQNKKSLLNPKTFASEVSFLSLEDVSPVKNFYTCPQCYKKISDDPCVVCPKCNVCINREVTYVARTLAKDKESSAGDQGGYVKGVVTYMVMDNLVVQPLSTISSITMLNKFNVKEVGVLEERVVDFGMKEGLKLLMASLKTKGVLTNIYL